MSFLGRAHVSVLRRGRAPRPGRAARARIGQRAQRLNVLASAAFESLLAVSIVGEKMLDCTEQITSKAASRAVGVVEAVPFQQSRKELVSQVAGLVL